jgi:hypothetical protein
MKTKKWQKPLLIILNRSRSEEAVLGACKTTSVQGPLHQGQYCQNASCKRETPS